MIDINSAREKNTKRFVDLLIQREAYIDKRILLTHISEDNFVSPEQWEIPEEYVEKNLEDIFQNTIAGHRNYYINYCNENNVKWSAPDGAIRTAPSWIIEYANV